MSVVVGVVVAGRGGGGCYDAEAESLVGFCDVVAADEVFGWGIVAGSLMVMI